MVLQHAGIPINKWAVVMNDDPRVYRAIESVVNEYRYKLIANASRAFKVSFLVEGVAIASNVFQADVLPSILQHTPTSGEGFQFPMDKFKEQWKSWMKKISSCDFPKGRLTGYYSNMVFSLDCLAAFAVCLAHVSHYSHLM